MNYKKLNDEMDVVIRRRNDIWEEELKIEVLKSERMALNLTICLKEKILFDEKEELREKLEEIDDFMNINIK